MVAFTEIYIYLVFIITSIKLILGEDVTKNYFCNETFKDKLFDGLSGVFNYEDILYAMRIGGNDDNIVWRFKLNITTDLLKENGYRFKRIVLEPIKMTALFPGFKSSYFESGFAITRVEICENGSDPSVCEFTKQMKNLTVIVGPPIKLGQIYQVYRFNGNTFDPINGSDPAIPYGFGETGLTDTWFNPMDIVTTAFNTRTNHLFAIKIKEKQLFTKHIGMYSQTPIINTSWKLQTKINSQANYLRLIEAKISINESASYESNIFLITDSMVYMFKEQSDGLIEQIEIESCWKFFGCDREVETETTKTDSNSFSSMISLNETTDYLPTYETSIHSKLDETSIQSTTDNSMGAQMESTYVWPEGIKFEEINFTTELIVILIIFNAFALISSFIFLKVVYDHYK